MSKRPGLYANVAAKRRRIKLDLASVCVSQDRKERQQQRLGATVRKPQRKGDA